MKKNLMNKFTLKILSLAIAILLWLIVGNVQNPVRTVSFYDIPVNIVNESYLAGKLEIPLLVEGKDKVNVRIKAERNVIKNLRKEMITAEADITQIVDMETTPLMVPVKVTCRGISEENITVSPGNIPIHIEKQISVEKVIAAIYEDTPEKSYEIGNIKALPEKVTISGPETLINKIDRVVASVKVSGMVKSDILKSQLKIYDKNQELLTDEQMSYLDLKDIKNNEVNVQVDLWKIKEIPIKAEYSGVPRYGYEVQSVESVPDTISIAGTEDALSKLKEKGNVLTIPGTMVDVTGKTEDFEESVDISGLLPEDTKLARDINSLVIVKVKVLPYNSKEYILSAADIETLNEADNVDVIFEQENVTVRVKAKTEDLAKLVKADIHLKIDLADYGEGAYEIPLKVTLPDGYELVSPVKAKVKLVPSIEKNREE